MAILMLAALIGVIVWSSRRTRRETFLTLDASEPNAAWRFDIRDMNAELHQKLPRATLGFYELRRLAAGRWERRAADAAWEACDAATAEALERAYARYNGLDGSITAP